ncbi:MAG: putative pppde peptidase family [Streblomastix strix]|uniref:Putative pppde peptidase family n=1 Tax=Streblomastix strix TaxID=222440 RepID=A0A5J4WWY1_9EUKA|nr:MAG: putative pppde peptidase family [Streblomastix strix]
MISISVYDMHGDGIQFNLPFLNIYHTGVIVKGIEYGFGGGASSGTGVWEQFPGRPPPNCTFKEKIDIGESKKSEKEISQIIKTLKEEYQANKYDLAGNNCNHFSNEACMRLCGKPIPSSIN